MKKILFISPRYEDDTSAGIAQRAFIHSAINIGYEVTVVSMKGKVSNLNDKCNIIHIKENRFIYYLSRILFKLHCGDLVLTPDHTRYSWNNKAFRVLKKICCNTSYDIVHSFSFPCSSHLLAKKISRKFKIKWIAHFMDPWVGNPIRHIKLEYFQAYNNRLERTVVENADLILHTNKKIVKDWCSRYSGIIEHKIGDIPLVNTFKPNDSFAKESNSLFTIAHIGTLHTGRTAQPFLLALKKVKENYPDLRKRLKVIFIGGNLSSDIKLTESFDLSDVVLWLGRISENLCDSYYSLADMFLAIDCLYDYDYFYPSKILKYYSYQHPVLGLVSSCNTILAEEMHASRNTAINLSNIDTIANFIISILENKVDLNSYDKDYWQRFTPMFVMDFYDEYLKRIL